MKSVKKFECKECGCVFEEERRFLNHKKVHGRKTKTSTVIPFNDGRAGAASSHASSGWGA